MAGRKWISWLLTIGMLCSVSVVSNQTLYVKAQEDAYGLQIVEQIEQGSSAEIIPPVGGMEPETILEWTPETQELAREALVYVEDLHSLNQVVYYSAECGNLVGLNVLSGVQDFSDEWGYSDFSEGQKTLYADIVAAIDLFLETDFLDKKFNDIGNGSCIVASFDKKFSAYGITIEEGLQVYFAVKHNHPEYFWMPNAWATNADSTLILLSYEYADPQVRLEAAEAISQGLAEYVSAAQAGESDYEKVRIVHDMLADNVEYAYKADGVTPENAAWAHNVVGVFMNKYIYSPKCGVVCEGYARAFELILNELGIENIYIVGDAGGAHAWNMVKIDGQYYYVDVTWDDLGDGRFSGKYYAYFCIPANLFRQRHTDYQPTGVGGKWLYRLPAASTGMECTYYQVYQTDFSGYTTVEEMRAALRAAAELVPGEYMNICLADTNRGLLTSAVNQSMSYISKEIGYLTFVEAADFQTVDKPATSISLDKNSAQVTAQTNGTLQLAAAIEPQDSDDVVKWEIDNLSAAVMTLSADRRAVECKFLKNGTYTITATAVRGGCQARCEVTVSGFSEEGAQDRPTAEEAGREDIDTVWINGATITNRTTKAKTMYKTLSWKTSVEASDIVTADSRGNTRTKKGKLIAGVTMTNQIPVLVKGKIVDTSAANIAKATVNTKGEVKVTAGKQNGTVYVWVMDTGDAGRYSCTKINVKSAAAKLTVYADASLETKYKKVTIPIGESVTVYLTGVESTKSSQNATECTYLFEADEKSRDFIKVEKVNVAGTVLALKITGTGLDSAKPGRVANAKVNVTCVQSNKKVSIPVTVSNPQRAYTFTPVTESISSTGVDAFELPIPGDKAYEVSFRIGELLYDDNFAATVKAKAYVVNTSADYTVDSRGKFKPNQLSAENKKIRVTLKNGLLTVKLPAKTFTREAKFCIFLCSEYNHGYGMCEISLVNPE